jgi:hypothetical protein
MLWTATRDAQRCQTPTDISGHGVSIRLSYSSGFDQPYSTRRVPQHTVFRRYALKSEREPITKVPAYFPLAGQRRRD